MAGKVLDETGLAELWSIIKASALKNLLFQGVPLSSFPEGSVIQLNEGGSPVDFYVSKHNYESGLNGDGRVLLVRAHCPASEVWNSSGKNALSGSDIDTWLNGDYKNLLDPEVQTAISTTKFYYTPGNGNTTVGTLERSIFMLSVTELGKTVSNANTEGSALPIAAKLIPATTNRGSKCGQYTRTPKTGSTSNAFYVYTDGSVADQACSDSMWVRPVFTLPSTFIVESPKRLTDVEGNVIQVPSEQIEGGTKIATGSYTGTGTYGSSNPCSLTFDFEPKFLMVYSTSPSYLFTPHNGFWQHGFIWGWGINYLKINTGGSSASITKDGKTCSWYASNNAEDQLNTSGVSYGYVAIG